MDEDVEMIIRGWALLCASIVSVSLKSDSGTTIKRAGVFENYIRRGRRTRVENT